jgi:drug/metabolite transporter (DMT)-like permease
MFWLSLVLIMLPIFLIQKGIERTEPVAASIILALTPIVTFTFQFLDHDRLKPSALTLLGICICFVFSIFGATAPKADIGNTA